MKNLLFLLAFIPTLSFSQVSSWRNNPPQQRVEAPRIQPSVPQRNDVSRWRTQTEPVRPGQPIPKQPLVRRWRPTLANPYGLMWGNWGWYQPYPYFWYDDWGYRNRGVVHIYENGRRDTVRHKKPVISFGLHTTTDNQFGGFFTIGNRGYFIVDFNSTFEVDRSTYFPYGTLDRVDFPLISDLVKKRSVYLGAGKRFKRTGVHAMFGFGNERVLFRGRDRVGEITFPKSNTQFTSIKFGALHDFKNFTLKFDTDRIRGYSQFGVGLNF